MNTNLNAACWKTRFPAENIAPEFHGSFSDGVKKLGARTKNPKYTFGGWYADVSDVAAGDVYRFSASFTKHGGDCSVTALLCWLDGSSRMVSRDYAYVQKSGDAYGLERAAEAPRHAESLRIELFFGCKGEGSCEISALRLAHEGPYRPRLVKLATTFIDHSGERSFEKNMLAAERVIECAAEEKPDIIVLTECVVDRGVDLPLRERSVAVPGPETERLGALARKHGCYLAFSIHEIDDGYFYNTAVLIGRDGKIAGKYRKTHLTICELEQGIITGDEFPVFDTDFGKVGLLVCWDHWFPESARMLWLAGAEVICIPTAGYTDWQSRARAADNGAYVVTACMMGQEKSRIIGPDGDVLAYVKHDYAVATVDLNKPSYQFWFSVGPAWGENRGIYSNERRPGAYGKLCGRQ